MGLNITSFVDRELQNTIWQIIIFLFNVQGVDFNSSLKFSFDISLPGKKTSRKSQNSRKVCRERTKYSATLFIDLLIY